MSTYSFINQKRMIERFIEYAKIDTATKENAQSFPSTPGQRILAELLAKELKEIGLNEVDTDSNSVVTAILPSNISITQNIPVIGLLAHLDTSNSVPADKVNPIVHYNYQGGDIVLKDGITIKAEQLKPCIGEDIVTSDGTTLLGADDKSGIAQITEVLKVYKEHPELKHPEVRVAFTPDEETGEFIDLFDIKKFGATAAYTIDGKDSTIIETSTFNAHNLEVIIHGYNVHPGAAKDTMINAVKIASYFIQCLPQMESPEHTDEWQGYYHVAEMTGKEEKATIKMLIRDFDYDKSLERVQFVKNLAKNLETKFPGSKVVVKAQEKYRNMKFYLDQHPEVVNYAKEGIRRSGIDVIEKGIRGGTDGATLSLKGLPTPNLGTGGHNVHGRTEFVSIQEMARCAANIINILSVWAEKSFENFPKEE